MRITVIRGDITHQAVDAVVNPANSRLTMGGGVAAAIRAAGGTAVADAARRHAPVGVGDAVVTTGGDLPADRVIHAPTMERPAQAVTADNTRAALDAALACAAAHGVETLATPGLGTGVGGVAPADAAAAMVDALHGHDAALPQEVVLVAYTAALHDAFRAALDR